MDQILSRLRALIPSRVFHTLQPLYHRALAVLGAYYYRHPSRQLKIVAVTGTKGKSTTAELTAAMLRAAGFKVALSGTIHFCIGDTCTPNRYKMSMPGRFFMQHFLRTAADAGCDYAVIEMTSEGARLWRHAMIELDALIFTNIAPEHIESHGSFEAYVSCKLRLRDALRQSPKHDKVAVANMDDPFGAQFIDVSDALQLPYTLKMAEPYTATDRGVLLTYEGTSMHSPLMGKFNIANILAAARYASSQGVHPAVIKQALEKLSQVDGRVQKIEEGQRFTVVVDYAHTPDSLRKLYEAFPHHRKICVLGNTGGGRDTWKRPEMGAIADECCAKVILTDEDSYDEDPMAILTDMKAGMTRQEPEIILDRRAAIRHALSLARERDVVLISGKGTDPYIMGSHGTKTPWSDERVAREELRALLEPAD